MWQIKNGTEKIRILFNKNFVFLIRLMIIHNYIWATYLFQKNIALWAFLRGYSVDMYNHIFSI